MYRPEGLYQAGSWTHVAASLGYKNLPSKAKRDLPRAEDFIETMTEAHVIGNMKHFLGLAQNDDDDNPADLPAANADAEEKMNWAKQNLEQFIETFISYSFDKNPMDTEDITDMRQAHSRATMTLGLWDMLFHRISKRQTEI